MLKIVVHKLTDKVLGCHMFGEISSEIIQMVSISLNAGITKKTLILLWLCIRLSQKSLWLCIA